MPPRPAWASPPGGSTQSAGEGHELGRRCMHDDPAHGGADGEGFEPSARGHRAPVFKTGSFGRSDNHPGLDRDGVGRRVEDPL